MNDTIQKIAGDMLALAELLHDPSPEKKRLRALAERLSALSARASAGEGGEAVACFRFRPNGEPHFSRWQDGSPPKFADGVEVECAYSRAAPASPATGWKSPFGSCVCNGANQCPGCNPNEAIKLARELAAADERRKHAPCMECGAKTAKEAETLCICSGDIDDCHGCELWPDATPQPAAAQEPSAVAVLVAAVNAMLAANPNDDNMWSLEAAVAPFNARKPDECANGCPPQQVCDYCQVVAKYTTPPAHGDGEVILADDLLRAIDRIEGDAQFYEWTQGRILAEVRKAIEARSMDRPTPEAQEAREYRLFDSQWVNVVNHAGCYRDMNKEDAVAQAVKLTEQAMAANINDCKWPRPRKADAALALPAQGEGNNG